MTKYIVALKEKEKNSLSKHALHYLGEVRNPNKEQFSQLKKPQFLSGTGVSFYTLNVNPPQN